MAEFGRVLRAKPGPHNHGKDLEPKTGKQPEMTQEGYRNVVFRGDNRTHALHPVGEGRRGADVTMLSGAVWEHARP